jgi:predicted nucleotidyltransferase
MPLERVTQFLNDFVAWALTQPDIRAAALVGSHARNTATESSDVDLVLLVRQPETFLQDTTWAQRFGAIQRQQFEDYGPVTSLRVWYTDGLEVEYGLTGKAWAATPLDEGTRRVISDGMRILFEREPLLSPHQPGLSG